MRNFADLPSVSCQLKLLDGIADIASFQAGAENAGWTNGEIAVAIMKASEHCRELDDVGVVLFQYCINKSWVTRSATAVK